MPLEYKNLKGETLPDFHLTYNVYANLLFTSVYALDHFEPEVTNKMGDSLIKLRKVIFQQICSFFRRHGQSFMSIGPDDFFSGLSKSATSFEQMVSWQCVDAFGMPGSCGNGGDNHAQYQISGVEVLNHFKGLWDPRTERRVSHKWFTLRSSGSELITPCIAAMEAKDYNGARKWVEKATKLEAIRRETKRF